MAGGYDIGVSLAQSNPNTASNASPFTVTGGGGSLATGASTASSGFPVWGIVAIVGGGVLAVVVFLLVRPRPK